MVQKCLPWRRPIENLGKGFPVASGNTTDQARKVLDRGPATHGSLLMCLDTITPAYRYTDGSPFKYDLTVNAHNDFQAVVARPAYVLTGSDSGTWCSMRGGMEDAGVLRTVT